MGKMSDLDLVLKDLRSAAESILSAANDIEAMFTSPPAPAEDKEPAPAKEVAPATTETAPEEKPISIDDVRTVLAALSNDGKKSSVKKLLAKYGSSRLSEIDPKNYAALLKDAEEVRNAG